MIEWSISLGNLALIVIAIVGGFSTIGSILFVSGKLMQKFDQQTGRITSMEAKLEKFGDVLIAIAVADTRLTNVEKAVENLRNGRGFITNRQDSGIQGEY